MSETTGPLRKRWCPAARMVRPIRIHAFGLAPDDPRVVEAADILDRVLTRAAERRGLNVVGLDDPFIDLMDKTMAESGPAAIGSWSCWPSAAGRAGHGSSAPMTGDDRGADRIPRGPSSSGVARSVPIDEGGACCLLPPRHVTHVALRSGMGTLSFTATISIDGYAADADGDFQWSAPNEEVFDFHVERMAAVSTEVLGRRTYQLMRYWEAEPEGEDWGEAEKEFA